MPGVQVKHGLWGAVEELHQLPGSWSRATWLPRELHPCRHWKLIHQSHYAVWQLPSLSYLQRDSPSAGLEMCLWLNPKQGAQRGVLQCHPVTSPARLPAALCSTFGTIFHPQNLLIPIPLLPTLFSQSISPPPSKRTKKKPKSA